MYKNRIEKNVSWQLHKIGHFSQETRTTKSDGHTWRQESTWNDNILGIVVHIPLLKLAHIAKHAGWRQLNSIRPNQLFFNRHGLNVSSSRVQTRRSICQTTKRRGKVFDSGRCKGTKRRDKQCWLAITIELNGGEESWMCVVEPSNERWRGCLIAILGGRRRNAACCSKLTGAIEKHL